MPDTSDRITFTKTFSLDLLLGTGGTSDVFLGTEYSTIPSGQEVLTQADKRVYKVFHGKIFEDIEGSIESVIAESEFTKNVRNPYVVFTHGIRNIPLEDTRSVDIIARAIAWAHNQRRGREVEPTDKQVDIQRRKISTKNGIYILVMDYIEGLTLQQQMALLKTKGALMPPVISAYVISRLAAGLEAVHGLTRGEGTFLVHSDIKPSNIFLTANPKLNITVPVLGDFGFAREFNQITEVRTQESVFKATFEYAAPEQIRGDVLSGKADVYSLGLVFYELLTGTRPLHVKERYLRSLKSVLQIIEFYKRGDIYEQIPAPHSLDPRIPEEYSNLVVMMLDPIALGRPSSMHVRHLLENYMYRKKGPTANSLAWYLDLVNGRIRISSENIAEIKEDLSFLGDDAEEIDRNLYLPVCSDTAAVIEKRKKELTSRFTMGFERSFPVGD